MSRPAGRFNAEKCIQYLRWIGVEIDEATARSWLDMQDVHRFLASTRRRSRQGNRYECAKGHSWEAVYMFLGRGKKANNEKLSICPKCGERGVSVRMQWVELRDGSVKDYRPTSERWKPLGGKHGKGHGGEE